MNRLVYIIIGVALLSGATSCVTKKEQKVKYIAPWMSFRLSDLDLKLAKEKAMKGDSTKPPHVRPVVNPCESSEEDEQ